MSIEDRVEKCRFMITVIVDTYFVVDQNLKLLLPLLYDEAVYSLWDYDEGLDGVYAMRMALFSHIISDLRAIMFDHDKKTASIHNIIGALEDKRAIAKIKLDFCSPTGVTEFGGNSPEEKKRLIETIQKGDSAQKLKIFEETLDKIIAQYKELKSSDLGVRVNRARSKMISHKEITTAKDQRKLYDATDFGLKFSDAKDFALATKDIIFNVNLLLLNSSYDLKSFFGHHDAVADKFWGKYKNA